MFEDLAVKQDVFRTLDRFAKPGAILATNTSYLDVDAIASVTDRPRRRHRYAFFSPAHVMKLLEVVKTAHLHPDVLATVLQLGGRLGKTAVAVGHCYGFVGIGCWPSASAKRHSCLRKARHQRMSTECYVASASRSAP